MMSRKSLSWFLVLLVALAVPAVARDATLTVSVDGGASYTNERLVSIELSYVGNEMPTEMRIFPATEGDWSNWMEYTDGLNWLLSSEDGPRTIIVEARYWVETATDETVYSGWRVVSGEAEILLDQTPPTLQAAVPEPSDYGWYNAPVYVDFEASDAGSGLAVIPEDVTLAEEGAGQEVIVRAVDRAGNETELTVGNIHIDLTPPVLTVTVPDPNEQGWYDQPVAVDFTAQDTLSGLAVAPQDVVLDQEGAGQSSIGTAVDKAGNKVELKVDGINIDMTPPELTVEIPEASDYGWYNAPVYVDFEASDAGSGLAVTPEDVTLAEEGAGQEVIVRAVDRAGNETELTVGNIHIDLTPPVLTVTIPDPNEHGWYNQSVTVDFDALDALSGLAVAPEDVMMNLEGAGQSAVGVAADKAGNEAELRVSGIHIDMTPPALSVAVPEANENGWYNQPVSVDFDVRDVLSGLASFPEDRVFSLSSIVTVMPKASDKAGNSAILPEIVLQIDVDAPLITLEGIDPGAAEDIWGPGPVSVSFQMSDAFCGIDSVVYVEGGPELSADGGDQGVVVQVTDLAGNMTENREVRWINIDAALPTTTILLSPDEVLASGNTVFGDLLPIDLTTKLEAFGVYDPEDVALGCGLMDEGEPIEGLNVYATILETDDAGDVADVTFFQFCEYAPAGGFYYFVLPDGMISGQIYEVWFEASNETQLCKARVIAP